MKNNRRQKEDFYETFEAKNKKAFTDNIEWAWNKFSSLFDVN